MLTAELLDNDTGEVIAFPTRNLGGLAAGRTTVSLMLPANLGFDDWVGIGQQLCEMEKGVQWWLGDWWRYGEHAYGNRAKAAKEGIFGRSFQALADAGWVAGKFETSRRNEVLPWAHHREVAALAPEVADRLLDEAAREDWSVRDLRQHANRFKNAGVLGIPAPAEGGWVSGLEDLVTAGKQFGAIYADPPWTYDNQGTRAATGNHYPGMSVDEICALPIRELAADDAHLHLWTTNGFLFECPRIFDAWGFEFRSSFVWVKPQMGIGNYWRNSHEFLLTAIRGDAKRFNDRSLMSWLECDRGAHSAKPEKVRAMIEKASPGPYLEMFGRREDDNGRWTVWGNQPSSNLFSQRERA